MAFDKAAVLAEIDEVLARCGASKDRPRAAVKATSGMGVTFHFNESAMVAACLGAIERNSPRPSYISMARETAMRRGHKQATINSMIGLLVTVRQDIEAGYLGTLEQQAREVVFEDFLEMAEGIAGTNKGAPAGVVLAVAVLEEHVRKLAEARGVPTERSNGDHRSFEDIVNDLGSGDDALLTRSERRVLGGWYSQRTEAAHGRFENVIPEDAPRIVTGVRDFIVRHPA